MRPHPARAASIAKAIAFALAVCPALVGCESLGMKGQVTSWKTVGGKTEVKRRDVKNWDEFKAAMGEVGTDFSDVAKEAGATTAKLVKALVEAPPPGKVKLRDVEPGVGKWEGNERMDFIAAARKKPDAPYDFTYVRIGVPQYDEFFKAAAELYALAFQMQETARRVRLAAETITGKKTEPGTKVDEAAARAKDAPEGEADEKVRAYAGDLASMWGSLGGSAARIVGKTAELVQKGQALIVSAPASITNPKTVLHLKLIVKGLEQSVSLVKDSAKILGDLTG